MIKDDYGNPKFFGMYRGVVLDNADPLKAGRLRLQVPQVLGDNPTGWAWGVFPTGVASIAPEVGSGVFVMFEGGDLFYPIWTGGFAPLTVGNPIVPNVSSSSWGSFYDTTDHHISSTTTAYPITINTADPNNKGVTILEGSKITVLYAGVYNVQFSAQVASSDTSIHNANIWIRKNGTDVPASNGQLTVPNRHGGVNGQMVSSWNYLLELNAGDYIQFMWQAESTDVFLETIAVGTTPTTPLDPSIIVTVAQVK